jgi:dienelactone hydrolase
MLIAMLHRRGIRVPRWIGVTFLLIAALSLVTGMAVAQAPSFGMLYIAGGDTLGIERVTPGPSVWRGDLQLRGQPRVQWTGEVRSTGLLQSLTLIAFQNASPDAPVLQRAVLTLDGDTVRVEISGSGQQMKQNIATRSGALVYMPQSIAMLDMVVARARTTPGAVDSIPLFMAAGGQTVSAVVTIEGTTAMVNIGPSATTLTLDADGKVLRASVPSQRLEVVRLEGSALAAVKVGSPSYDPPQGAPYRAEHVKIPAKGGHAMAATLTLPANAAGRVPVVVTISGSGGQDRDEYIPIVPGFRPFRQFADSLGRRGVAVLRFDDRGIGESTGDHAKATSEDFADDVRSIVAWLRARSDIDPERVMLMGHSEGGMIAPMVAATDPRLAGIVLLAGPGEKGEPILRFQLRNSIEKEPSLTRTAKDSALRTIDGTIAGLKKDNPWMRFFLDHDPLPVARQVRVPTYIVQGATDQQVTPNQATMLEQAFRAGGNRDVTVQVFADRNHLFLEDPDGTPANYGKLASGRIGGDVLGPVVDWVVARARAGKPAVIP